jgi:hypothetical protein
MPEVMYRKFGKGLPDNAGLGTPLRPRHCERSEAIHSATQKEWIASSLRSRAQTLRVCRRH